jgi:hypothetical protein
VSFDDVTRITQASQTRTVERISIGLDQEILQLGSMLRAVAFEVDSIWKVRLQDGVTFRNRSLHIGQHGQPEQSAVDEGILFQSICRFDQGLGERDVRVLQGTTGGIDHASHQGGFLGGAGGRGEEHRRSTGAGGGQNRGQDPIARTEGAPDVIQAHSGLLGEPQESLCMTSIRPQESLDRLQKSCRPGLGDSDRPI